MKARILLFWDHLRVTYWFVPTLMALSAIVASFVMVAIDSKLGEMWVYRLGWLSRSEPAGARLLLSTVAGSMTGVAGVAFSITIVSVVYASGQYGPRVLRNFMSDVGNQFTLGTFIATFLYCLMVLRVVRVAGEIGASSSIGAFVPQLSVTVARHLDLSLRRLFDRTSDSDRRAAIRHALGMLDLEQEKRDEL